MLESFLSLSILWQIYFIAIGTILLILLFTTLINSLFGPYLKKAPKVEFTSKVSVLVPARNEERNIDKCINSVLSQDYPNFELIILDDNSEDNTYNICTKYKDKSNFQVIKGEELPEGWLGKNNACKQLSEYATGDILIFTDADNFHNANAISNTVGYFQKYNLGMLTAFPEQKMGSFFENLIIPIIDLIVYSGLVLWTTLLLPYKIFAAANGQWIAFTREAYQIIGGHEAVKNHIVEDVALSRIAKTKGIRLLTTSGKDIVYGKMYSNFSEIWQGLSKNVYGLTDFKPIPFFILSFIIFLCGVFPYILLLNSFLFNFAILIILLNVIWRGTLAINFHHNLIFSLILHPVSLLMLIIIGFNSFIGSVYGTLQWKGRIIRLSKLR